MDFALSEEQEMFRTYVRKYLDNAGQTRIAREYIAGNSSPYQDSLKGLADLGTTGITVSEEYGGLGLSAIDAVPILEELGRALLPGVYAETIAFAVPLLEKYGTEEQKKQYLPRIATGELTVSLAWLEAGSDYHATEVNCQGTVQDESVFVKGIKSYVPFDDSVGLIIVLLRTGNEGEEGLSLLLVDVTEDLTVVEQKSIDETRTLHEIHFKELRVPTTQLLGEEGKGWVILQEGLLYLHAALSSLMVGGMERLVEMTAEYATIREQFGQPIGRFQAIKHPIVDMKLELELARSLSYYANWALNQDEIDKEAAIYSARAYSAEAYIKAASQSIQIHGGIGFTMELDCHLYLRRARYYENYLGSLNEFYEYTAKSLNW